MDIGEAPPTWTSRKPSPAERSLEKRDRIVDAVITVLSEVGMGGLTHRRVAKAAGVSLSVTTYYYETKAAMLTDASQKLLAGYLQSFKRIADEYRRGEGRDSSLDEFVTRLLVNATSRNRRTSLAWCEIILDSARTVEGHQRAQRWFADLESAWSDLAAAMGAHVGARRIQAAIDMLIGLLFIILPLGIGGEQAEAVRKGENPVPLWGLDQVLPEAARQVEGIYSPKAERTRAKILGGAINLLNNGKVGAISYRAVAEESGVALTAPAYYFGSIDELIRVAEAELFRASKDRYRTMLAAIRPDAAEDLADVTAAILIREATEFGLASLAHYSVWLEAARSATLRVEVAAAVLDQAQAWQRRLQTIGDATLTDGIYFQALFVGQLVRVLASGVPLDLLSSLRLEFLAALNHRFDSSEQQYNISKTR